MKKVFCIFLSIILVFSVIQSNIRYVAAKNKYSAYNNNDLEEWYQEVQNVIIDMQNQISLQSKTSVKLEKQDLISKVKQKTDKPIYKTFYDDFDNNNAYEAFIFTGTISDDDEKNLVGDLWFSNSKKAVLLESGIFVLDSTKQLETENEILLCMGTYAATSWPARLWKVNGDEALAIFEGDTISNIKNKITSVHSTYDCILSDGILLGHTWKKYYFYYSKGKIYEYGAKKINDKQFTGIKNASTVLKNIKDKYKVSKVGEIYFRKNNTIQVNFSTEEGETKYFYYAHLNYDSKANAVSLIGFGEGSYMAALYPDIAVYPQLPKNIAENEEGTSLIGSIALQPDVKYNYDMNGDGKNESIKYTVKQDGFTTSIYVYIDGKKIITEEQNAFTFYASISNIDKSDKYLELSVMSFSGDNFMNTLNIYRYLKGSKKMKKLFSFPNSEDIYWLNFCYKLETNGNGAFTWESGGIYGLSDYCEYREVNEGTQSIGACSDIQFILKDDKIELKSKMFKAADSKVTTLKDIELTDKASSKGKRTASIKSGSSITITKIKYIKIGEAYLYIKYGNKNGWYHVNAKTGVVFIK